MADETFYWWCGLCEGYTDDDFDDHWAYYHVDTDDDEEDDTDEDDDDDEVDLDYAFPTIDLWLHNEVEGLVVYSDNEDDDSDPEDDSEELDLTDLW